MLGVIILLGFFILQHHLMTTALSPCFLLPLVSQIQWLHVPRSVYGPIVLFYCSDSPMARCFSYRNFVVNLDVQQTKCSSLTLFFFLKYLGCNLLFAFSYKSYSRFVKQYKKKAYRDFDWDQTKFQSFRESYNSVALNPEICLHLLNFLQYYSIF